MCPLLTNQASRFLGGGRLAAPVPVLGAEVFENTGFDSDTYWDKGAGWTIANGVATHAPPTAGNFKKDVVANNVWYLHQFTIVRIASAVNGFYARITTNLGKRTAVGTYYSVARGVGASQGGIATDNNTDGDIDNLSLKPITLASMFSTRPYSTHATTKAMCTIVAGTRAGVVCNLDSATSPANFVIASHDGTTARLTKCVAGTYTALLAVTTTYVAGAYVEIRRILATNDYELWYNNVQVGAAQTITDAGIISNTLAGMFNTYAGNTLTAFSCIPSTVPSYAWATAGGAPTPVAAYMPKGAASLAASYVNLVAPGTNNASPGTAPTFDTATGWTFNGSSQHLTTGILSAADMTILVRFSDATGDNRAPLGSRSGSTGLYMYARLSTQTQHSYNNSNRISVAGALASGVMAIAGVRGYLNGVEEAATLNNTIATPTALYIGAVNEGGVAFFHFAGNIQAVAIYSSVLTAPQLASVSAAMAAL